MLGKTYCLRKCKKMDIENLIIVALKELHSCFFFFRTLHSKRVQLKPKGIFKANLFLLIEVLASLKVKIRFKLSISDVIFYFLAYRSCERDHTLVQEVSLIFLFRLDFFLYERAAKRKEQHSRKTAETIVT